jgi:hypothetical protein
MCERALPLIAQEPELVPEHLAGPDLPSDETVRRRFSSAKNESRTGGEKLTTNINGVTRWMTLTTHSVEHRPNISV